MPNKFLRLLLAQPAYVLIMVVALIAFGVRAVMQLPIEAFPDVQDSQVQIVTQYPGMAPEEVERAVTLPIEREMSGVPLKTSLRSKTITGLSVVTLIFADGTNDYFARQQVLERLANVDLPPGAKAQLGPLATAVGEILRYVVLAPPDMPEVEVRATQDWIVVPALRSVPGVADVPTTGGAIKEYQIQIDPAQLRRFDLSMDDVAKAVGSNSANVGAGLLRRGDSSLVVRGVGIADSLDDLRRIVVASPEGKSILVSDIGEVKIGNRPRAGIAAADDKDSVVAGVVVMTRGGNPSVVLEGVMEKFEALKSQLPKGVRIEPTYMRSALVSHTVHTVAENLLVGAGLVVAILMIFLRNWRASLIVASVIPLALVTAFIMMDMRGIPANLISLGAVDFGIIIDSAVVLVEAIMVRLAFQGQSDRIVGDTVLHLGRPILFSKAIIIMAFLPIFTFQRVEGRIFSPVAFTLSMALLGAVVLTVTWVPVLMQWATKHADMAEKHAEWIVKMQRGYRRLLEAADRKRIAVLGGSSVMLAVALASAPLLGTEFLPKLDEGNIWLTVLLPTSSSLEKTKEVEKEVRAILRSFPEVKQVVSAVGRPDDGTDPKGPNNLELLADLKPRDEWQRFSTKEELIEAMSRKLHALPGLITNFSQVIQDNVEESLSGVKGEIAVKVFGPDLQTLQDKSDQIAAIVASIRGATDVAATPMFGQSELKVEVDRVAISRYGLSVDDVNNALATGAGGRAVNTFYEQGRRFDVTVRLGENFRRSVDDIGSIPVDLPGNAGSVTLADVAKISLRDGAAVITREGGERNGAVKANLSNRDQGSFVAEAQERVAREVKLPPGYRIAWGGQFENQQRAVKRLAVIVPISVLMIFTLLFWAFRSVRWAVLVLLLVPPTAIGGIAGLAMAGLHFSVSAAVGFIAVAGIAVQNGVIMVEEMLAQGRDGVSALRQAIDGAVSRLRPVLMTALMAGLGLLPAALSHAIGSETQRPFAVVVVGGVLSSTIFTLLLLPLLFPFFARQRSRQLGDDDGHEFAETSPVPLIDSHGELPDRPSSEGTGVPGHGTGPAGHGH